MDDHKYPSSTNQPKLGCSLQSPRPQIPKVEALQVRTLRPYPGNARTHSKAQIRQLAASIKAFGFIVPIVVDGENGVVAGHGRLAAAQLNGMEEVPVIHVEHLSEAQLRVYRLADNKIAENAHWNPALLKI